MKKIKYIFLMCIALLAVGFASCSDDDDKDSKPIHVTQIYLEDYNSTVPDRPVEFARLGQMIRIEGSGFLGMKKVYINGYDTYFNMSYVADNSMLITINSKTPVIDAEEDVRNTIRLVKSGVEYTHDFVIRDAPPSVTSVSHTMPQAGEMITIYGTDLVEIHTITFPGGITADAGSIVSAPSGTWCRVKVPSGITEGGSILLEGANGGAYSPPYFNFKKGLLFNFDGVGSYSWGGGEISGDLNDPIPTQGDGPKSQNIYRSLNKDGKTYLTSLSDVAFGWANSDNWPTVLNANVIPPGTATNLCGVQMDIYVEGEWNSGSIRMVIADGSGASRYCMVYAPWVENGKRVPFVNPGCWFTVTFPFSDSADYVDKTFADVLASSVAASYKQWGPHFDNVDIDEVACEDTSVKIYYDNLRVVLLEAPQYSDFDDEEE
ncbi:glycan-binding surface protein [Bacteroides sp. 51]|uniref:glycan-binding surface protein n=1 Tax=Bacteroides sp. 51 TaxID=2302938 RepID=UPI0013D4F6CC|nr:glycan-binding surface protein [Bacteroides sp. 51]NDV81937.1 hypothetical protein [Bacteroides sp. 51]